MLSFTIILYIFLFTCSQVHCGHYGCLDTGRLCIFRENKCCPWLTCNQLTGHCSSKTPGKECIGYLEPCELGGKPCCYNRICHSMQNVCVNIETKTPGVSLPKECIGYHEPCELGGKPCCYNRICYSMLHFCVNVETKTPGVSLPLKDLNNCLRHGLRKTGDKCREAAKYCMKKSKEASMMVLNTKCSELFTMSSFKECSTGPGKCSEADWESTEGYQDRESTDCLYKAFLNTTKECKDTFITCIAKDEELVIMVKEECCLLFYIEPFKNCTVNNGKCTAEQWKFMKEATSCMYYVIETPDGFFKREKINCLVSAIQSASSKCQTTVAKCVKQNPKAMLWVERNRCCDLFKFPATQKCIVKNGSCSRKEWATGFKRGCQPKRFRTIKK